MNNTEHFGELTPRMNSFREQVLDKKPYISAERAVLATESYQNSKSKPPACTHASEYSGEDDHIY